jgi:hypothetical protein
MTFGVPVELLPITYQGELKTANHMKWIGRRHVKEAFLLKTIHVHGLRFDKIDLPGRNDVILRRGRIFHDHPGNVRMRGCIDFFKQDYKSAPLGEKANIASKIVQTIKEERGRFLERDGDGWWVEVLDKEAGKRVSKAIRSARPTKEATLSSFTETQNRKRAKINETTTNNNSVGETPCFSFPCFGGAGT